MDSINPKDRVIVTKFNKLKYDLYNFDAPWATPPEVINTPDEEITRTKIGTIKISEFINLSNRTPDVNHIRYKNWEDYLDPTGNVLRKNNYVVIGVYPNGGIRVESGVYIIRAAIHFNVFNIPTKVKYYNGAEKKVKKFDESMKNNMLNKLNNLINEFYANQKDQILYDYNSRTHGVPARDSFHHNEIVNKMASDWGIPAGEIEKHVADKNPANNTHPYNKQRNSSNNDNFSGIII